MALQIPRSYRRVELCKPQWPKPWEEDEPELWKRCLKCACDPKYGQHEVSSLGRIRVVRPNRQPRILKPCLVGHPYMILTSTLYCKVDVGFKIRIARIHTEVWKAFNDATGSYIHVVHRDEDPTNNRIDNLQAKSQGRFPWNPSPSSLSGTPQTSSTNASVASTCDDSDTHDVN